MTYKVIISDGTVLEKCIEDIKFNVDTIDFHSLRTHIANSMIIRGKIDTDEGTVNLYKWSMIPGSDSKCYKEIKVEIIKDNQLMRKVSFSKAFVVDYSEEYSNYAGIGTFTLYIKQFLGKEAECIGQTDKVSLPELSPVKEIEVVHEEVKNQSSALESVSKTKSVMSITDRIAKQNKMAGIDTKVNDVGNDFSGTLRGETVQLSGVKVKEIIYIKRTPEEAEKLRKAFESTERKKFLQSLTENVDKLKAAGLSDSDIARMKDGLNPKGWQVHHKIPLDDGGTNAIDNLVLIKNEPFHKTITNFQNSFAKQLNPGEVKKVKWPIPEGNIYPPIK